MKPEHLQAGDLVCGIITVFPLNAHNVINAYTIITVDLALLMVTCLRLAEDQSSFKSEIIGLTLKRLSKVCISYNS